MKSKAALLTEAGGIKNFLVGLGTGVDNFLDIFRRFDFAEDDKNIRESFEKSQNNLNKLNKEFVEGVCVPVDKNISPSSYKVSVIFSFIVEQTFESAPE